MITCKPVGALGRIVVFKDGVRIGFISRMMGRKGEFEYYFNPKGQRPSKPFASIDECKKSLEDSL